MDVVVYRRSDEQRGGGMIEARIHAALAALEDEGLAVRLRKPLPALGRGEAHCEVDLWMPPGASRSLDRILEAEGFHYFRTPGRAAHRFYLGIEEGRWIKFDAKSETARGAGARRGRKAPPGSSLAERLRRRRPLGLRRQGAVIAVVGPDGAGKGTLISSLRDAIPVATTVVYLGARQRRDSVGAAVGVDATRTNPGTEQDRSWTHRWRERLEPLLVVKGLISKARSLAQGYFAAWQGRIVFCDRHPVEVLAIDPRRTRLARELERRVVLSLFPWPDRVLVLDAPATTMFSRKGEHSVAHLERWRAAFRSELAGSHTVVVDTDDSLDAARLTASSAVWDALAFRRGWTSAPAK